MGGVEHKTALLVRKYNRADDAKKEEAEEAGFFVEETDSVKEALKIINESQNGTHAKIDLLMAGLSFPISLVAGLIVVRAGLEAGINHVILETSWELEDSGEKADDGGSIFRATDIDTETSELDRIVVPNGVTVLPGTRTLGQFEEILRNSLRTE
ncbi:MAG: hypothetical protein WC897_03280 [Candidatus Gracilibacteria bacterium]